MQSEHESPQQGPYNSYDSLTPQERDAPQCWKTSPSRPSKAEEKEGWQEEKEEEEEMINFYPAFYL